MLEQVTGVPKLPDRPADGHKGLFGRVLIVGGSDEMLGAPVLAGAAALRMGAGLVQIAVPRAILPAALSITPELIGLPLGAAGADARLLESAARADAVAIGPGLGQSAAARARVLRLIKLAGKPMVIDADALNILASHKRWPASMRALAVLTPHPGEIKRLAHFFGRKDVPPDNTGRIDIAAAAARTFNQVVVLKGHRTVVTDSQRVYINETGDSALSKAGTGDVLTGIITAFLGQKMDRFDAACLGVFLHGRAGELAGQSLGRRSVLARDVIAALPRAMNYG